MVKDLEDLRRAEPPKDGLDERAMLEAWLEFHNGHADLIRELTDGSVGW
jgi:hypothetical protein